ncbi:MAG: hypothetical protein WA125_17730 [Desulfosporosinus sp.]
MAILRDEQGNPKPQYETATANVFEAAKGSGGAIDTNVKSSVLPDGAATSVKQDTLNAKDFATQTTLAALLAKIIAAPATEATLSAVAGYVDGIEAILTAIRDTSGIKKITDPLPAGTNILGKVGIDQTTDGTTNRAVVKISQTAGENIFTAADGGIASIGAKADVAVTDPAVSASVIAALKGVLKQLQGNGTGAENVKLKDSAGVNTLAVSAVGAASVNLINDIAAVTSDPIVGVKTIVATAVEVFAGASVKTNRRTLNVKNEDPVLRFRLGPSTVNQQTGFPIEPGALVKIKFDPSVAVPIYTISEGASLQVTVWEE